MSAPVGRARLHSGGLPVERGTLLREIGHGEWAAVGEARRELYVTPRSGADSTVALCWSLDCRGRRSEDRTEVVLWRDSLGRKLATPVAEYEERK